MPEDVVDGVADRELPLHEGPGHPGPAVVPPGHHVPVAGHGGHVRVRPQRGPAEPPAVAQRQLDRAPVDRRRLLAGLLRPVAAGRGHGGPLRPEAGPDGRPGHLRRRFGRRRLRGRTGRRRPHRERDRRRLRDAGHPLADHHHLPPPTSDARPSRVGRVRRGRRGHRPHRVRRTIGAVLVGVGPAGQHPHRARRVHGRARVLPELEGPQRHAPRPGRASCRSSPWPA